MKNFYKKIFLFLILMIPSFSCVFGDNIRDIMSEVFSPSKQNIIYIGDDKDTVGHSVLRESRSYNWGVGFYEEAPLLVKIVKIILKITVVLSITMILFYSIKFMIQVFNGSDLKSATAKKDLINVFIGLLIAMFSITAVTLISSIGKSTFTTNEFGFYDGLDYGNTSYVNNYQLLI